MELLKDDERYRVVQADCIEEMARMPAESVDFAVFSPPFSRQSMLTTLQRMTSVIQKIERR